MRVLVADNDARVRSALHMLLKQEPGEAVIAESSDLDSMAVQMREFRPELVLLEWELPGRAAAALLIALSGLEVRPRVIVLSGRSDARKMALALGADSFVYKGDPPDQLLLAYRQNMCARGGTTEAGRS
jgi:DNA-binding NarL/FixJ family response regulator